ncbi:MAG: hypothetical protein KJ655_04370, partial [Candidatus Thermoplasmatota archaeon]|nr:hypothetical protein [Candidatus Thermoplasmatota archaeon]
MLEGQVKWLKNRGTIHYVILSLLMFIFVFSVFGCIVYDYMINGRINKAGIFIVVAAFFLLLFPYTIYMFVIIPKCVGFSFKGFYLKWVYKENFVPWAMIGTSESFLIPWGR